MEIGWLREREEQYRWLMDRIVHWIGLESIDIWNRILWLDQVWLICILDNGHHTCMYMYIVLTVFPDEVIVSI